MPPAGVGTILSKKRQQYKYTQISLIHYYTPRSILPVARTLNASLFQALQACPKVCGSKRRMMLLNSRE